MRLACSHREWVHKAAASVKLALYCAMKKVLYRFSSKRFIEAMLCRLQSNVSELRMA